MKFALVILAASLSACAISPASQSVAKMQAAANQYGLHCPAEQPTVIHAGNGEAFTPAGPIKGGTAFIPARYADASPAAHDHLAHEIAHTCGANETQARGFTNYWKSF